MPDELIARLERLAGKYEDNHLTDHARGVRHALREVRSYFAPVELRPARCSHGGDPAKCNVGYDEHLT